MIARTRARGFSLIELMVGMVLGLFLLGGVITVFQTTSNTGRVQQALSRVLENGRYASQVMGDELRMAGAQYCASFANALPVADGQTPVRPIRVNVSSDALRPAWIPDPPSGNTAPYAIDPGVLIRGYECDADGDCEPALPTASEDVNVVPDVGTTAGRRAAGTDVLTIRYLAGVGATIQGTAGGADPVNVGTAVGNAPLEFPKSGVGLAYIADCGNAEIFAAGPSGTTLTHTTADGNYSSSLTAAYARRTDARVFNFARDFLSVTYWVGVIEDEQQPGRLLTALMRQLNGGEAQVVVEGVERLDFTYVVADGSGNLHYLDGGAVQANADALPCPPLDMISPPSDGCLWRAVRSIEASLLLNSIRDDGVPEQPFRYSPDGGDVAAYGPAELLPSGLPAGRMMRREFRLLATVHNLSR